MLKNNFITLKFTLALIAMICLVNVGFSQVTAVLLQPPPFRFNATDLWRVTLTNAGAPVSIYMKAIAKKNNVVLVEATSSIFTLQTSLAPKLVNAASISPIDLKKNSTEIDDAFKTTGSLPSGKYNICIYVYAAGTNMLLSEYCNDYEVLKTIKGDLISPRDQENIKTMFPIFNWMPPSPITPGNNVTYEINIVEILERQTPYYAMTANPYVFSKKGITNGIFQYPLSAMPLENDRRYAWRIKTYLNAGLLSESEIREFSFNGRSISAIDLINENRKKYSENKKNFMELPLLIKPEVKGKAGGLNTYKKLNLNSPQFIDVGEIEKESPFKFSGSYNVSAKHTNRQKTGSQIPRNLLSIQFDPALSIYDLPFTFAFYYDTQQQDFKQNINSFAMLLKPEKLFEILNAKLQTVKGEIEQKVIDAADNDTTKTNGSTNKVNGLLKFFSNFKTLGIGETYPTYSEYILNGTKVTGLDMEFNPGWFYLALSGNKNLDAIASENFSRKLFAGKIGYGGKEDSHFHITFMKAQDNLNSLNINDSISVTPYMTAMENVILGTDGKLNLFKDRISINGEVSGSVNTDDLKAPDIISEDIPAIARSLISIKLGTHYDLMYKVQSVVNIPESETKLTGGYRFIGPGYTSLGAPSFTNGVKGFNAGIEQYFADRKINFKLSTEQLTSARTFMEKHKYDFAFSLNFENAPFLNINYTPYSETNNELNDSLLIENSASTFSIATGINLPVKTSTLGSVLTISTQTNESKLRMGDYSVFNILLNETYSFAVPLSLSAALNITKINSLQPGMLSPPNTYSYDLGANLTLFDKWVNTLSLSYQKTADVNSNMVLTLNSSVPVYKFGNLTVNIAKNFYREVYFQEGENKDIIVRATLSKSW